MNYKETLIWMYNQLPVFQHVGASAYKKDLTNTILLMNHLNNPHQHFKTIHVGGTNGKGSTSSMLTSIFMEAGYKVGLYTSPHLKDFRERITVNGKMISKPFVKKFITENQSFFENQQLSFFEMTVGMAFQYFAEQKVDVAIIEVGMGGRLDSTNVITPLLSVITNIGLDHTQFLGDTLEQIAFEKAGIIKNKIPIVIGETTPETKPVFLKKATEEKAPILFAEDFIYPDFPSELLGSYQIKNKKTVLTACKILKKEFSISETHIKNGIKNVVTNTGLKGRWQVLQQQPLIVCDTAHNTHGLKIVIDQIKKQQFQQLHIVLGMVNDKDISGVLNLLPQQATYYFCKPNIPRGLAAEELQKQAQNYSLKGKCYKSVKTAYAYAKKAATPDDFIYIGGSTFVVAEVI